DFNLIFIFIKREKNYGNSPPPAGGRCDSQNFRRRPRLRCLFPPTRAAAGFLNGDPSANQTRSVSQYFSLVLIICVTFSVWFLFES
ncbi:unnamed protein product, partial [Citrullus colocynthis]